MDLRSTTLEVRAMTPDDLPGAIDLWANTESVGLSEGDDLPGLTRYLQRSPGCSAVSTDGEGRIIGAVIAGHDGRRGWLYHLAVEASHRGRGCARRMVEHAVTALRKEGIGRCSLFVYDWCEPALAFWQNLGAEPRTELKLLQIMTADFP